MHEFILVCAKGRGGENKAAPRETTFKVLMVEKESLKKKEKKLPKTEENPRQSGVLKAKGE